MKQVSGWWIPDGDVGKHDAQLCNAETVKLALGQIDMALALTPKRGTVVQGGARCGLWPLLLADKFARVYAFEPDLDNRACAERNLVRRHEVRLSDAALSNVTGRLWLSRSLESNGMHYVTDTGRGSSTVRAVALDDYQLPACDAVFLDVEGYELSALIGMAETIERCRPVIVVEENNLIARYGRERGAVARWLGERYGYRQAAEWYTLPDTVQHDGKFHGSDLIFAP